LIEQKKAVVMIADSARFWQTLAIADSARF